VSEALRIYDPAKGRAEALPGKSVSYSGTEQAACMRITGPFGLLASTTTSLTSCAPSPPHAKSA